MTADFHLVGADEFKAALTKWTSEMDAAVRDGVAAGAHLIEANAKLRADGRPGPIVRKGRLRSSIGVHDGPTKIGPGTWTASVGPTAVYARRIELGFHGTDSRGRHYDQPPYPYMQPGFADSKSQLRDVFYAAWARHI